MYLQIYVSIYTLDSIDGSVCIYIYTYIYIYIYTYIYIFIYLNVITNTCIYIYIYIYVLGSLDGSAPTDAAVSALEINHDDALPKEGDRYVYIYMYIYIYMFIYIHISLYMYTCIYIYTRGCFRLHMCIHMWVYLL
jgi:hypothetical protein